MEVLPFDDIELDVMDVGGDKKIVPLWKHYLLTASAIIYVMDCSDVQRIEENKTLLTVRGLIIFCCKSRKVS